MQYFLSKHAENGLDKMSEHHRLDAYEAIEKFKLSTYLTETGLITGDERLSESVYAHTTDWWRIVYARTKLDSGDEVIFIVSVERLATLRREIDHET